MASRPRLNAKFDDQTSKTADFNTPVIDIRGIPLYSLQAVWTETGITGTISVQVSSDYFILNEDAAAATWDEVASTSQNLASITSYTWSLQEGSAAVRLALAISAGTLDTFKAYINAKGF